MAASGRQALLSTSNPSQRHRLAALVELGTQSVTIEACFADLVDHMPCEDPKRNSQLICKTLFLLFWVFFCFCFFERMWSFFYFMGFFVCLFTDWVSYCVYGFVSWIYFLFFWIWRLGLVVGFGFGVC